VIASSPTNLQLVMDVVAENAARICGATDALVYRREGDELRLVASYGDIPAVQSRLLDRGHISSRAVIDREPVHVHDIIAAEAEFPISARMTRTRGTRTVLSTPLLREGVPIGVIGIRRQEVHPFTDKQIALLQTFADQAVIAIENVRLFNETKEALERQTATSEILRVIGSSPTDVQPVFETIARSGVSVCAALGCAVFVVDGDRLRVAATHGVRPERVERLRHQYPIPLDAEIETAQTVRERRIFHLADIEHNPNATASDVEYARLAGYRTRLMVPMVRGDRALGLIAVTREAPTPFSDQQVDLLKTFADQAVIAIENVRLFKELQASNRDLTEALEQQTEEYSRDIHASGQHLLSLINDILDLSKIEAGRMELELTDFHLPTALDNALTLVRERAGRRAIALHLSVDERLGQVQGDERKIRQVVLNLLSNAIKFTPEGGRIEVAAVPKDGSVEVSVSDSGVGIAPEDQDAIFEEFRQVGTADKKAEGTGLGLTLCRKFIELHGGRVWVRSEVGLGSTFTFTIPVRRGESSQELGR
jgi:signal transduction histidine kinase